MSDDLGKKVQQIAQLLGQDNVPDNVKELISLIAASLDNKGNQRNGSSKAASEEARDSSSPGDGSSSENISQATNSPERDDVNHNTAGQIKEESGSDSNKELLDNAKKALSRFNAANDPRINLLNAIKPFMNTRRQKKIGNCIQLLQIASLSRLLNEQENR